MDIKYLMSICVVLICVLLFSRRKYYGLSVVKSVCLTSIASISGYLSTYLMYYIENGEWGGMSFYGAVLFFPVWLFPVSLLFKVDFHLLMDYVTPIGLVLLIPFKLNCYIIGCCGGKPLWFSEEGIPEYFPSQIVEMIVAIILVAMLLVMEHFLCFRKKIYPSCLILYGSTRFVLNYYRWEYSEFLFGLRAGNFWSIVAMGIGIIWIGVLWLAKFHNRNVVGEVDNG